MVYFHVSAWHFGCLSVDVSVAISVEYRSSIRQESTKVLAVSLTKWYDHDLSVNCWRSSSWLSINCPPIDCSCWLLRLDWHEKIHLIEKTLSLEKCKPWTMGANSIENLKFFSKIFTFTKLFATMHSKKRKTVSSIYGSQLHQCWTHKRFLQLKSVAISLTHTWKS